VSDPNLDFKQSSSRYSSTSNIELYLQWQTDRKLSGMGSSRTVLELEDSPRGPKIVALALALAS